jgi:hypothetical protein
MIIPALRKLRQKDHKLETSPGCKMRPVLKLNTPKTKQINPTTFLLRLQDDLQSTISQLKTKLKKTEHNF